MTQTAIDALFLDFYGTVSGGDRLAVERTCFGVVRDFGLDLTPAEFAVVWGERFFAMIDTANADRFLPLREVEFHSLRETLGSACDGADLSPYVAELERYWADPPLQPEAKEFLAQLDIPVCCVSNADDAPLRQAVRKHGLSFAAIVTSESTRSYKPHDGIFRVALEVMGCRPERVLHVGDSLHSDVAGGQGMGLKTAWVCRDDRIHDIGNAQPEYTVSSLRDVLSILSVTN